MNSYVSFILFVAILGGIGYGLWRFKIGPFAPKTASKAPMQRMGKEPGPRPPRNPEPPVEPAPAPTEPPPAP